jgi:predicted histidine transporter YuiF (NhaC family)
MTSPDPLRTSADAPPDTATAAPTVVGPRAAFGVCVRVAVILLAPAALLLATFVAQLPAPGGRGVDLGPGTAVRIVTLVYVVHLLATFACGWPAGILTAHLVRDRDSEVTHVLAFAACGAILGVLVPALLVLLSCPPLGAGPGFGTVAVLAVVYCPVGAIVAGLARAWAGHAARRRARTSPPSVTA